MQDGRPATTGLELSLPVPDTETMTVLAGTGLVDPDGNTVQPVVR